MKKTGIMIMVFFTTVSLAFGAINWHTMEELTRDITDSEKPIYILVSSSQDYFGKVFEEKVLGDDVVARTMERYYYCVRFWASEDDKAYTFYGKTYRLDGSKHELLELLSVSSTIVPAHIFLDQRPSAHPNETGFNVLSVSQGYMQIEDFLPRVLKYPAELKTVDFLDPIALPEEVRIIIGAWDFNKNLAKIAEATPENFENLKGSAISSGGLGGGEVNTWVSTVQFSGAISQGTIHKSDYDGSYYASFVLVEADKIAPWDVAFKKAVDILLEEIPADESNHLSWEIDEPGQIAQLTQVYENYVYYIELAIRDNEYDNTRTMELTFWGNSE